MLKLKQILNKKPHQNKKIFKKVILTKIFYDTYSKTKNNTLDFSIISQT